MLFAATRLVLLASRVQILDLENLRGVDDLRSGKV